MLDLQTKKFNELPKLYIYLLVATKINHCQQRKAYLVTNESTSQGREIKAFLMSFPNKHLRLLLLVHTGIIFKKAAIGMPMNPMSTLTNHCEEVRGVVLANVPRNSMMMTWKTAVQPRTATKT